MNEFLQYAYLWHYPVAATFLIGSVGGGVILSINRKRKVSIILFMILVWVAVVYPLYTLGNYQRWQQGIVDCSADPSKVLVHGVCYKSVKGYVPVTTWVLGEDTVEAIKGGKK